jgi:hypothetical protein
MRLRTTLFTVLALCGTGSLRAGNGNEADPTALLAVQYNVHISFGPQGAGSGIVSCTNPFQGTTICPSVTTFNIPSGNRFVITSISGAVDFNPNGGTDVMSQNVSIGFNVGGQIFFSQFPLTNGQVVQGTTYYTFNNAVHMFADPAVGFPEILVSNLNGVGPDFTVGYGYMNITFQGYLVPTS